MHSSDRLAAKAATCAGAPPAAGAAPTAAAGPGTPPPRLPAAHAPKRRPQASAIAGQLPPNVLLMILGRLPDSIDRWQAAAGMALAGAFGPRSRVHLEPFWLEEAQAAPPRYGPLLRGPYSTTEQLEKAARASTLLTGWDKSPGKAALEALVPQSVPPHIIADVRAAVHRRRALAALEAAGLGEYAEYWWVWDNILDGTPRLQYLLSRLRRDRALTAALAARGLRLRSDSTLCQEYVRYGKGNVDEIADTMAEMRFYFRHTQYKVMRENYRDYSWATHRHYNAVKVSAKAKKDAWHDVLQRRGRDWLLALPDLPPTLRRRLGGGDEDDSVSATSSSSSDWTESSSSD